MSIRRMVSRAMSAAVLVGALVPSLSAQKPIKTPDAAKLAKDSAKMAKAAKDSGTVGRFFRSETPVTMTLTLNIKAKFTASEKDNDKAPDYRIFAGATEFGAAWKKTVRDSDREYLSVKLDDPSFPAPIYATLIEVEGQEGLQLIWSRPSRD